MLVVSTSCAAVSNELNRNPANRHGSQATYEHAPVLSLAGTIGPSWRGRYDWSHYGVLIYTNPSLESSI